MHGNGLLTIILLTRMLYRFNEFEKGGLSKKVARANHLLGERNCLAAIADRLTVPARDFS